MAKREVVNRGWLSDAQSSKKLKGQWKKASSLGMHLSAKYSGARKPTFTGANIILPTVVFGKHEEAAKTISDVLQWWEAVALRLPTMYPIARSILAMWSHHFPFGNAFVLRSNTRPMCPSALMV